MRSWEQLPNDYTSMNLISCITTIVCNYIDSFFSFCINHFLLSSIKAFSLGAHPLLNIAIIEQAHLNLFVYPCFDSALWNLAKIHYEYGEIPSKNHINKNCVDGVGLWLMQINSNLYMWKGQDHSCEAGKEYCWC